MKQYKITVTAIVNATNKKYAAKEFLDLMISDDVNWNVERIN